MKNMRYIGTYESQIKGNQVKIPKKLIDWIISKEDNLPDFFYGFVIKEEEHYISLLSPKDFEKNKSEVETIAKREGLLGKFFILKSIKNIINWLSPKN